MPSFRCLSLHQPWAELILQGRKTIESRTWRTAHRGLFALHAAFTVDFDACERYDIDPTTLITSALVGVAELVDMIEFDDQSWAALRDRHLVTDPNPQGRVGWVLANPRRLASPIPMRGLPGLFPLDDEIVEQIAYE